MRPRKEVGMSALNVILNVLWILTGGIWMALGWLVAAALMAITIIGLPWARAHSTSRSTPCCRSATWRCPATRSRGARPGHGPSACSATFLWLVLAGWRLALGHLITAGGLALTVIGLPFAWAHFKLAGISLRADRQDDRERRGGCTSTQWRASALAALMLVGARPRGRRAFPTDAGRQFCARLTKPISTRHSPRTATVTWG